MLTSLMTAFRLSILLVNLFSLRSLSSPFSILISSSLSAIFLSLHPPCEPLLLALPQQPLQHLDLELLVGDLLVHFLVLPPLLLLLALLDPEEPPEYSHFVTKTSRFPFSVKSL